MAKTIELKSDVQVGVLAAYLKFVGGLLPDENGKLPRNELGELVVVAGITRLIKVSPVKLSVIQLSYFPGLSEEDLMEMITRIRDTGLEVQFVLMVGGADPMDPKDEDAVVEMLLAGIKAAKKHNISTCSSTSIEEWMKTGATPKEGADYQAAIAQNTKVHLRVFSEGGVAHSCIKEWQIEFLRSGEFQTFTNLQKAWDVVRAMNKAVGQSFFKVLVDAAHCGDSDLSIDENIDLIQAIGEADELGLFHASAPTTRGCLSTDDGWIGALLTACVKTGKLRYALVEAFNHEDEGLTPLRAMVPGFGVDTTDGRSYEEVILDGVVDITRRLNNLVARGVG